MYEHYAYIMRDEFGEKLLYAHFLQALPVSPRPGRWARRFAYSGSGPVPGTGRLAGNWGLCLRHPKTTHDRRWAQALDEDVPARPSRQARGLPSAWDDQVRSDYRDRCWKRYRQRQFKVSGQGKGRAG